MKTFTKSISAIILVLLPFLGAKACISEAPTHNRYLFSVFNLSLMSNRFAQAADNVWQRYLGNEYAAYTWSRNEIMKKARRNKDTDLIVYCTRLNSYLDTQLDYNSWDYPTRAQIAKRHATLIRLMQAAKAYRGKRFRNQYALMRMRALFELKRYPEAIAYWHTTGKHLQKNVYYDMMRNLYAGCLWRTGKHRQAIDIYAEQEDYASLKYCVRGYRNVDGIQKVYATNPNSPTLTYLVQDFVNNVQETMDEYETVNNQTVTNTNDIDEWMKTIDAKKITTAEADRFIAFARNVISEGKTNCPCLWQTAIGCIEHQNGRYAIAKKDLTAALTMNGTERMKDNARAIYAVNSVFTEPLSGDYSKWLTDEMRWLDVKSAEDRVSTIYYDCDHYRDVEERMVFNGIVPKMLKEGRTNAACVLLNMMNETDPFFEVPKYRAQALSKPNNYDDNPDYRTFYFDAIDTLPLDKLIDYADYLRTEPSDSLENYAWHRAYRDPDFYNDIIGTRLLAKAEFAKAIPYLEKVSLRFLNAQNIAPYAYYRDYNVERWMGKQKINWDGLHVNIKANKKLQYCRDMERLLAEYNMTPDGEERRAKAYRLATMWYQGSCEGDCWWLKRYSVSVVEDSAQTGTADFIGKAINLLNESKLSDDFELQEKSLYALAYIRGGEPWYYTGWDNITGDFYDISNLKVMPQSRQYRAMAALLEFRNDNMYRVDDFVSRCDILKVFERNRQ